MNNLSVGQRLYFSVLAAFLLFAASFIVFQQHREKKYKVDVLNIRLQDYNDNMNVWMQHINKRTEQNVDEYVKKHSLNGLRVTLISEDGKVLYDNKRKDYKNIKNHSTRKEVIEALRNKYGEDIDRNSETLNHDYFYSATYFPENKIIIRSALPYDNDLVKALQADKHYVLFALLAIVFLTIVLLRFTRRLGANITKLKIFAERADHNEDLETEDLIAFPNDELGEIAEKIIKLYKRLQSTRQEQNVLKKQLTQNIAHELKTPVASIQGYLETIIGHPNIDKKTKEQFLERCYAQSQRLTSLLQDISTLNRIDDAATLMDFSEVNISKMVQDIMKETALLIKDNGMAFNNQLPDNVIVKGNYSLLYSIFRNLTDNAIAYAGRDTTITISGNSEETKWHFTFADNGIGVSHEHLSRLFERFYRIDKGRSRKMGGTGLGLAIVKNAIIIHGGNIRVSNNEGGGLRFDFDLKK